MFAMSSFGGTSFKASFQLEGFLEFHQLIAPSIYILYICYMYIHIYIYYINITYIYIFSMCNIYYMYFIYIKITSSTFMM